MNPCLSKASDEELLSVFLPTPVVREILADYGGNMSKALLNLQPQELYRFAGVGQVKARQLQYLVEITRRLYRASSVQPPVIRSPQDIYERVRDMTALATEAFRVILLGTKNHVIAEPLISQGSLNATIVTPREVFNKAVRVMAASVILVHNHPSGDPTPSQEDIGLTQKMVEAGKVMDIAVLDHVIIGDGQYVSFKEKGLI